MRLAILQAIVLAIALPGCAVYQAATRPPYKDTSILEPGVHRETIIDELGEPCRTYQENGARVDVFEVSGAANSRHPLALASFYAVTDLVTFGIGELWHGEDELQVRSECATYTVTYSNEKAKSVDVRQWVVSGVCGEKVHAPACAAYDADSDLPHTPQL
jgi:hypothetical protein